LFHERWSVYFVLKNINFTTINTNHYHSDYDAEACALKICLEKNTVDVLTTYRSPAGDFNQFLVTTDNNLKFLMNFKTQVIICGDIYVNYRTDSIKCQFPY
jgi:fructosamine-3-kinase